MNSSKLRSSLVILGTTSLLAGCSTMSFDEHSQKYNDLSINQLLENDQLADDERLLLGNSLLQQANTSSQTGDHMSALKQAQMAHKLDPDNTEIKLSLAESLFGLGKYSEAEAHFADLSTSTPSADAFQGYGLSLLAQRKSDQAQRWLNSAVAEDPNLWRSWNGLGIIYDGSASWKLAEQAYKAGIAVSEHNATINNNLGLSYLKQRRLQEALISFENVQALPGGKELSDLYYRTTLGLSGNLDAAVNGISDRKAAKVYNNLGVISIADGKPIEAVDYLKKAIATSPSYYPSAVKNLEIAKSALQ